MSKLETPFRLEPGKRGWPREWPTGPRIPRERAVRVVDEHRNALKVPDYQTLLAVAQSYPWAYPSRALLAKRLGIGVSGVSARLRSLERRRFLESFPAQLSAREVAGGDFDNARSLRRITLPGLHVETKPRHIRRCEYCGDEIPPTKREGARFCRDSCRKHHSRSRTDG